MRTGNAVVEFQGIIAQLVHASFAKSERTTALALRAHLFQDALLNILSQVVDFEAKRRGLFRGAPASNSSMLLNVISQTVPSHQQLLTSADNPCGEVVHSLEGFLSKWRLESIPSEYIGAAFESQYGVIPPTAGSPEYAASINNARRSGGVFFTPRKLAVALTRLTLGPLLRNCRNYEDLCLLRIVDPAVGAGVFLLEAMRLIGAHARRLQPSLLCGEARSAIVRQCLYGVDKDPYAVALAKTLLWLEAADPALLPTELGSTILIGDSLLSTRKVANGFDWRTRLPDIAAKHGFDAVLSNPPWGRVRPDIKRFHRALDRDTSDYQGQALRDRVERPESDCEQRTLELWTAHIAESKAYAGMLRASSEYKAQYAEVSDRRLSKDNDLYKFFIERSHQMIGPTGRIGMIVPGSFCRSEGAAGLRRFLLDNGRFDWFLEFENRRRLFPIHGMFRFALSVYQRGEPGGIENAQFRMIDPDLIPTGSRREAGTTRKMSRSFLEKVSPGLLVFPEIRSAPEQALFEKLHRSFPTLGDKHAGRWNVEFVRELDMTVDSKLFVEALAFKEKGGLLLDNGAWQDNNGEIYLPVFEGRMVHQYDYAAKAYRSGSGRRAKWESLGAGKKQVISRYLVEKRLVATRSTILLAPRAGFCDVTGHANERSVLAALIPANAVCGNKVPTCRFSEPNDIRLPLLWLGIANSYIIDWLVRRRLSTTLNFFVWNQIPFPRIDPDSSIGREIIAAAARLSCHTLEDVTRLDIALTAKGHFISAFVVPNEAERLEIKAELDQVVATLFRVGRAEFELVLSDFKMRPGHTTTVDSGTSVRESAGRSARLTREFSQSE
jgi:hypothetical protein